MLLNGIDIDTLPGLTLLKFNEDPRLVISYDEWIAGAIDPVETLSMDYRYSTIEVQILIEGTEEEIVSRKSILLKMFSKCTVVNSGFAYDCKLNSAINKTINSNAIDFTILCDCSKKYKDEISIILEKLTSQEIKVQGTTRTPCIYEIRALTSIIDFEINGIKVHDIPINTTLVIDGERCLILLDGKNKFLDTEIMEFPYLDPGSNTIKMNNTNCEVKIKYKPRFV